MILLTLDQIQFLVRMRSFVNLLQNGAWTVLHYLLNFLFLLLSLAAQVFVNFIVELTFLNLHKILSSQIKEQLRAFVVCHYVLDRENRS